MDRYFIDQDEAGNWWIVKIDKIELWEMWLEDGQASEEDADSFARRLDGLNNRFTFSDPQYGPEVLSF